MSKLTLQPAMVQLGVSLLLVCVVSSVGLKAMLIGMRLSRL